jgi:RecA-family ATPase
LERLVKLCAGADLVVLDTAARLHPGAETNESLAVLASALESIATRTGACVVLVRHVSMEQARGASTDSVSERGGARADRSESAARQRLEYAGNARASG